MKTSKALTAILVLAATTALAPRAQAQSSGCRADTDCGTGMTCLGQTDTTVNQCVCRWPLSCSANADCGDGFVCQPATKTTCSGSSGSVGGGTATRSSDAGTGAASGGSSSGVGGGSGAPVPPADAIPPADAGMSTPPACTSSTSYPGTCQPKVSTCNSDADCPASWTCVAAGLPVAVAAPTRAVDAGVAVPVPPDVTTTTTTTVVKACQAPCGRSYGGSDSTQGPGTVSLNTDAGTTKGTTPTVPPVVAPSNEGSGSTGNSTDTKTSTAAKTGGGGCSVGSGNLGGRALALLGLGLAALLGRRRRPS